MWEKSDTFAVWAMGTQEVFEWSDLVRRVIAECGGCEQRPGDEYPNLSLFPPSGLQCVSSKYSQKPGVKWSYKSPSLVT